MPAHPPLPNHVQHRSPLPPARTVLPGALLGGAIGAAAGAVLDGLVATALLALAGALLVVALIAALPDRPATKAGSHPPAPHPSPPRSTPTTTLAVPPPGPDAPPGWYRDPDPPPGGEPGIRRLWDGERWTEHRWAPRDE